MKKVLAFDIGGTNTRLALINENFEIEKKIVWPTICSSNEEFMNNCVNLIKEFDLTDVVAIGAGVPGVIEHSTGKIEFMANVGLENVDFARIIKKEFNLPVFIRNDAEVACLCEASLGSGKNFKDVFFITISTGLGGALCIDKKIQNYPIEIGHEKFDYNGTMYCYEHLVAGSHVSKLAKLMNVGGIESAKDMFMRLKNNDHSVDEMFKEWLSILNKFIEYVENLYHPNIYCFTGGVMKSKDLFFDKLIAANPNLNIVECEYSEDAGLVGSGVLAFQGIEG